MFWATDASKQFVCGWVGGAAGVLASHPLDTIRVQVTQLWRALS